MTWTAERDGRGPATATCEIWPRKEWARSQGFFFKKKDTQNSLYLILFLSRIIKVATIDIQLEKSLHTKITIYDLYKQCIGVRAKDFNSMKIRGGRSISKSLRVKNFDPPKI
jgi:hypothetical protein